MPQLAKVIEIRKLEKNILCKKCSKFFLVNGQACPVCNGSGKNGNPFSDDNCHRCRGYGIILNEEDKICPGCKQISTACPKCGHIF